MTSESHLRAHLPGSDASRMRRGDTQLHVDLGALRSMQGRVTSRDEGNSRLHESDRLNGNASDPASLQTDAAPARALTLHLDLPRTRSPDTNTKQETFRHYHIKKSNTMLESERNTNRTSRRQAKNTESSSKQEKHKRNLQWLNFKSGIKSNDVDSKTIRDTNIGELPDTARRNSVVHPDDWALIEREIKRYARNEGNGSNSNEAALQALLNTISMAQSFHRLDWRVLARTMAEGSSPSSDFFSIYSWSMRKRLAETNPLTAYMRDQSDPEPPAHLFIGHMTDEQDSERTRSKKQRDAFESVNDKYVRTPRGYYVKNEKSKTPGELAIEEARVRNSVTSAAMHNDVKNTSQPPIRDNVQLPDIHLPHKPSSQDHLFRRFLPGKTIRASRERKSGGAGLMFDLPLQGKTLTPLSHSQSQHSVPLSTDSRASSLDSALPTLRARTQLVSEGGGGGGGLYNSLNAHTMRPIPRTNDRHALAAYSYQNRLRYAPPPQPPPATPISHQLPGLGNFDDVINEHNAAVMHLPVCSIHSCDTSRDHSARDHSACDHRASRDPYCQACMSDTNTSSVSSLSSSALSGSRPGSMARLRSGRRSRSDSRLRTGSVYKVNL